MCVYFSVRCEWGALVETYTDPGEKNEKSKELIRSKVKEYMARAETLKDHVLAGEDKRAKKAVGANGFANGGSGGKGVKYAHDFLHAWCCR